MFEKEFSRNLRKVHCARPCSRDQKGLDGKTKQLINIAIQTAVRNPRGVKFHAMMAKDAGASRQEVLGAVVMNLHLTGLTAVLDSLPTAIEGFEGKW